MASLNPPMPRGRLIPVALAVGWLFGAMISGCNLYLDPTGLDAATEKVERHIDPVIAGEAHETKAVANPFGEGSVVTVRLRAIQGVVLVSGDDAWALDAETRSITLSLPLFDDAPASVHSRTGLLPGAADTVRDRIAKNRG